MTIRPRAELSHAAVQAAAHAPERPPLAHPAKVSADRASFAAVLASLGDETDRGEALVRRAAVGRVVMPAHDLLALQAGIYRYGEVVDLATRLVDRAQTGLKTVLQGQ